MANERERRHQSPGSQPAHDDAAESPSLIDQIRTDPAMRRRYERSKAWRREQAQAADGPTSQPLTPEQEAQQQAEVVLIEQQRAQDHRQIVAALDRLNTAWAAQHGFDYKTDDQLKASFWRELGRAAEQSFIKNPKQIVHDVIAGMKRHAQHQQQIMSEAQERGIPMTPMGASGAAFVSHSLSELSGDIEACREDLVRALEAQSKTDKALAALKAAGHMGKAGLGAYTLAEPLAGFTEAAGAAGGGMSMMPATAGVDGASGAVSGAAVAEATSAPVGPGLAGAAAKEVIDDGRSYSQRKKDGGGESKDPLPDAERAQIDENKFTRYSMDPNNPNNGGKAAAFRKIGYDIDELSAREAGAQNVIAQLRQQLSTSPATTGKSTSFGARFEVRVTIQGPAGSGSLVTVWQIDSGGTVPRLITNWLEVFK